MGTKKAKAAPKTAGEVLAGKSNRKLTRATLIELYAARRYLGLDTLKETGLRMPVEVYFKDPARRRDASKVQASTTNSPPPGSPAFATVRPALALPSSTTIRPATC